MRHRIPAKNIDLTNTILTVHYADFDFLIRVQGPLAESWRASFVGGRTLAAKLGFSPAMLFVEGDFGSFAFD